tara:strand:+ start:2772 stop:3017 length:246 start_codon:yes stop_codon:yes gene_type:complete
MKTEINKNHNSEKGQKGFTSKYSSLGKSNLVRIPILIAEKINQILTLLNVISEEKGISKVILVLDNIIIGLENVIKECGHL